MKYLKKYNRQIKIFLFLLVISLFFIYFLNNVEEFKKLKETSLSTIVLVIFGQSLVIFANIMILKSLCKVEKKHLSFVDSAEITAYSSLVNFFGFFQAGIGLRAVYLKNKLNISYKKYSSLTLFQFGVLFCFSIIIILIGFYLARNLTNLWYAILTGSLVMVLFGFVLYYFKKLRNRIIEMFKSIKESNNGLYLVVLFVGIQLCGSFIAYTSELVSIGANPNIAGLLIYTGMSQFSIFLAFTPGAIGFREGLLILVSQTMLISINEIVVAATLDRLIYFITLALFAPAAYLAKKRYGNLLNDENHA